MTTYRQIHGVRVVSLTSCQPFKYLKKPLSHDPLLGKNIFSWVSTHEINLEIHWVSQFFGHTLFGENAKFPIFWTYPVWRKREIPNFLVRNRVPILGHPVYMIDLFSNFDFIN